MYSSPLKLRMMFAVVGVDALAYASVRALSANAFTSPVMSMMLVRAVTGRTVMVTLACGMFTPPSLVGADGGSNCQGARFIRENAHKVGQACNVEDLHVVLAEAAGEQATVRSTRSGEQADNQCDAGAIDVVHVGEVEQDGLGTFPLGIGVGSVQHVFREGVDLAMHLHDGDTWPLVADVRLKRSAWHCCLLLGT